MTTYVTGQVTCVCVTGVDSDVGCCVGCCGVLGGISGSY